MEHYLSSVNIDLDGSLATSRVSDTDAMFQLDHPITCPKDTHMSIALRSFSMPYGFYLINTGINDSFIIETETVTGGTTSIELTIPAATYTISTLLNNINSQLTPLATSLQLTSLGLVNDQNKKQVYFTLSYSLEAPIYISFQTTAYREFGISSTSPLVFVSSTTGYFNRVYDLSGMTQIFLRISNLHMDNRNMQNISGIIATIPIAAMPFDIQFYEPATMIYQKIHTRFLNQINFQILNQSMQSLGDFLMAGEFRVTLTVKFEWEKDIIHPSINKKSNVLFADNIDQIESQDATQDSQTGNQESKDTQEAS
jgi:hypothetical protein